MKRWVFRAILASALAVALGYLPYQAYGPEGLARALRLEDDLRSLREGNRRLEKENAELRRQIKGLRDDRHVIERVARDELGMVRPEDIVFQLEPASSSRPREGS
jgi:cell division protein FtsB